MEQNSIDVKDTLENKTVFRFWGIILGALYNPDLACSRQDRPPLLLVLEYSCVGMYEESNVSINIDYEFIAECYVVSCIAMYRLYLRTCLDDNLPHAGLKDFCRISERVAIRRKSAMNRQHRREFKILMSLVILWRREGFKFAEECGKYASGEIKSIVLIGGI